MKALDDAARLAAAKDDVAKFCERGAIPILRSPFAGWRAIIAALKKKDDPKRYKPLAEHLRAAARGEATLGADELIFAANLIDPPRRGPQTSPVIKYLKPLEAMAVAGKVLRLSHGCTHGEVANAIKQVANQRPCHSEQWVRDQVRIARKAWGEGVWRFKCEKFRAK